PAPASGWVPWLIDWGTGKPLQLAFAESFAKYMAFGKVDAGYDWRAFDFDKDVSRLVEIRRLLNATDLGLSAVRDGGGKLVMYQGWADTALTPYMSIDYYEAAVRANGPATGDFFRLFMVPGMFHCRGGVGVERFDAMTAVINWVEGGTVPDSLTAAK